MDTPRALPTEPERRPKGAVYTTLRDLMPKPLRIVIIHVIGAPARIGFAIRHHALVGFRELRIAGALTAARLRAKPPSRLLGVWSGAQTLVDARDIAIMAHYDSASEVRNDTIRYVQELARSGFATVFLSSAPDLSTHAREELAPYCAKLIHRRNVGYDFGSYSDGVEAIGDLSKLNRLLIVNDSVYGPFSSLTPLLARCDDSADVWGMTDSTDFTPHLQSYFLLFTAKALGNPAVSSFWRNYPFLNYKPAVIRVGELGLARALRRAGLRMKALFPIEVTTAAFRTRCATLTPQRPVRGAPFNNANILYALEKHSLNQTHFFWRDLLALGCPFIKRELVDRNPVHLEGVETWRSVVARHFKTACS